MRLAPAGLALSLALALTASVGNPAPPAPLDPRAAILDQQGRAALAVGKVDEAIDAFEAALALAPGSVAVTIDLAQATRRQGLQGKALHYYREALARDPRNLDAIAGEGEALVEKGAVEKARRNLTRLQGLCTGDCGQAKELADAIAKGPPPQVVEAEPAKPDATATASVD